MSRVAVLLADGFEEVEAVTPIDYLRRADIEVMICGVGTLAPRGTHGMGIQADISVEEISGELDAVILPGGLPGASNLAASPSVRDLCRRVNSTGKIVAAICAAPALALNAFGLLEGRAFTCYPGFEEKVTGGRFQKTRVVRDGNLVTSRGPGTAGEFALELIEILAGAEAMQQVKTQTLN